MIALSITYIPAFLRRNVLNYWVCTVLSEGFLVGSLGGPCLNIILRDTCARVIYARAAKSSCSER